MDAAQVQRLFELQREKFVFEDIIRAIYEGVVKPGDAAIDGGANIGDHTVPLSRCVGSTGIVHAYEPVPATVERLKATTTAAGCSNVVINTKALGAAAGRSSFVWVENRATRSALKAPNLLENSRTKTIDVEIVTLDDELAAETRPVKFIKLDLEGGEYDCLRGAARLLARHGPVVVFENGGQAAAQGYGYTAEDLFSFFGSVGYTLLDLFGRPYGPAQWSVPLVPYYTIGVPSARSAMATELAARAISHVLESTAD